MEDLKDATSDLKKLIREIPDYPKPGILFYDLTTLLQDPRGFHTLVDCLCEHYNGHKVDIVAGIEARGFIFAPALAYRLNAGFVPIRKPKKLPAKTMSVAYQLEYGRDSLEIHADAIRPGQHVLLSPTRWRNHRRSLRRRTDFPQWPRQTLRHRRLLVTEIRPVSFESLQ
jgi:adenine/guanine phosphoribosyltransferase-like PRPP-binding protein